MPRSNPIILFLDSFVPKQIQEDPFVNVITQARARALVGVLGFSIVIPFLTLLMLLTLQVLTGQDFTVGLGVVLAMLVVLVIQHMLFQTSGNLELTATAFSIMFYISVLAAVFFTGGWDSPVSVLFLCSPLVTYLISGYQHAMYGVVVTFSTGMVFLIMHVQGIQTPQIMHVENLPYVKGILWFISALVLVLLFVTQEILLEDRQSPK